MYVLRRIRMSKYTKTEFVHIPEGPDTEELFNIYSKISYYDVYATAPEINWLGKKNANIRKEMAWDVNPSLLLVEKESFRSYLGGDKNIHELSYEVNGKIVHPTKLSAELSKKQWNLLFDLWDDAFTNMKGMTATKKSAAKHYLDLIEVMKKEDLINNLAIHDVIM